MHADQSSIRKNIGTYIKIGVALLVFTVITVAVNQVHLAIPLAITVALIIATMKGSMVAAVFMMSPLRVPKLRLVTDFERSRKRVFPDS